MIKLKWKNGYRCTIIECDVCKTEITDLKDGMVVFNSNDYDINNPVFVHKGECDRSYDNHRNQGWMELSDFINNLFYNVSMK